MYSVTVSPLCPLGILQNNTIQEGIDNVTSVVVNIILWTSLNYSMQVILLAKLGLTQNGETQNLQFE